MSWWRKATRREWLRGLLHVAALAATWKWAAWPLSRIARARGAAPPGLASGDEELPVTLEPGDHLAG